MKITKSWIFGQEARENNDLPQIVQEALACEPVYVQWPVTDSDEYPIGKPDLIVADLRKGADWNTFRAGFSSLETEFRVPCVAVVEDAVPIQWAHWIDQQFVTVVVLPPDSDANAFRIDSCERHRPSMVDLGHRILETETLKYVTYTPELFHSLDDLTIAARHNFAILLIGETGTGKTTLAKAIHELSPRKNERFLTVPCGALPNELIDSELFGHVKGAFTGADRTKEGKFEAAQGGTILLDEIDTLGLEQQAKLLRVLETGEYEPVGSNDTRMVQARVIVASNVGVNDLKNSGRFRPDLYYRLNQVKFEIPPLRKRPRDVVPLAMHMIEECCRENPLQVSGVHPSFLEMLRLYDWPGNIRELRNEVRRAVLFSRDGIVRPDSFSPDLKSAIQKIRTNQSTQDSTGLAGEVAQTEQDIIEQMLCAQKYNRAATARALGISRVTLYNKIRKYNIHIA